jgi:hypothetical protein
MSIISQNLLLSTDAGGGGGYQISRSLRFSSGDSSYLSRTPASAGNRRTWTWAGWVKRSTLSTTSPSDRRCLFSAYNTGSDYFFFYFSHSPTDTLVIETYSGTTAVYRDTAAWMHVVLRIDTTAAAATDRLKLYINGVLQTISTPSITQNSDLTVNTSGSIHNIGSGYYGSPGLYFDGYLADIYFIDGQALDPTSFTTTDATTGQLIPKAFSGTYGTNGFHLDFADNSAATASTLGKDTSGNGNNWTPNNLSIGGSLTPISSATGAIPILNTTDIYGRVIGTGVRSDSLAANLLLCLPLTTSGGRALSDDVSPTGRISSLKTVTLSNISSSSTEYAFYGSSLRNTTTSTSCIDLPGQIIPYGGTFTIECWVYRGVNQRINLYNEGDKVSLLALSIYVDTNGVLNYYSYSNGTTGYPGSLAVPPNQWTHVAFVTDGSTVTYFVNGVKDPVTRTWISPTQITGQYQILSQNTTAAYAQDYRIYNGIQKYTSTFTPPKGIITPTDGAGNDSLVDVPTNGAQTDAGVGGEVRGNYCTLNALANGGTLANGNLDFSTGASHALAKSTFAIPSSGLWYAEATVTTLTNGSVAAGFGLGTAALSLTAVASSAAGAWEIYASDARYFNRNGSQTSISGTFAAGTILQLAVDPANSRAWIGVNNTWYDSSNGTTGNPSAGTNPTFTSLPADLFVIANTYSNTLSLNFGQRAFAYTAPSGFKALCTTNLPAPLVTKPSTVMDVKLYTGNGGTQTISGLGFSPDFIWIKSRSAAYDHQLADVVRGVGNIVYSNLTNAENTLNTITGTTSDGFTVSAASYIGTNASGQTFAAWNWDAGSSTVTNTQGSITSQVRANATAGFSVITYTGTGNVLTLGHGLGVKPAFFTVKRRDVSSEWTCYHSSLGASKYITLQSTAAAASGGSGSWNSTEPTSSLITIGNSYGDLNANGGTYLIYAWSPVVGYSAMGSFVSNGAADNVFVYTGFRPKFLVYKSSSAVGSWVVIDTSRAPYNVVGPYVLAESSAAEGNVVQLDILSNGFKCRDAGFQNGTTYIYFAFAEAPFNYARAR